MPSAPTLEETKTFLQITHSQDDPLLVEILAAVEAQQLAYCRDFSTETEYPPSLRQAFYRRVARTLNARSLPLGIVSAGDFASATLPRFDAEIRNYEATWARLGMA